MPAHQRMGVTSPATKPNAAAASIAGNRPNPTIVTLQIPGPVACLHPTLAGTPDRANCTYLAEWEGNTGFGYDSPHKTSRPAAWARGHAELLASPVDLEFPGRGVNLQNHS